MNKIKITDLPNEIILNIIGWILKLPIGENKRLKSIMYLALSCTQFSNLFNYNYIIENESEYGYDITSYSLKYKKFTESDTYFMRNGPNLYLNYCNDSYWNYYFLNFGKYASSYTYYKNGYKIPNFINQIIYSNRIDVYINNQYIDKYNNDSYDKLREQLNEQIFIEKKNKNLYNYLINYDVSSLIITNPKNNIKLQLL